VGAVESVRADAVPSGYKIQEKGKKEKLTKCHRGLFVGPSRWCSNAGPLLIWSRSSQRKIRERKASSREYKSEEEEAIYINIDIFLQ
jgi:hypothetical protein